jgi:hypothetical protein
MKSPFLLLLPLILCQCGGPSDTPITISETREMSPHEPFPRKGVSSAERFGKATFPFVFEKPESWSTAPATSMRMLNYTFGPSGEGECYLSATQGPLGGIAENINRWRTQMGLPEKTIDEIAKEPLREFLGNKAFFVDLSGAYKGVGDTEAKPGYRMLTMYLPSEQITLIVKMIGPEELVEAEVKNFDAFCNSLQFRVKAE